MLNDSWSLFACASSNIHMPLSYIAGKELNAIFFGSKNGIIWLTFVRRYYYRWPTKFLYTGAIPRLLLPAPSTQAIMFALKPIYLCAALLFFTIASASSHTKLDSRSGCTDSDKFAKGQLLTQEQALQDDVVVRFLRLHLLIDVL